MSFTTPIYPSVTFNANDGPQMNAVAFIFIVLSFITLVLRYFSRLFTHVSIELDDWLIVAAAVLSWGYSATVIVEVEHNHYGQPIGKTNAYYLEGFNKGLHGLAFVYPFALTFNKLSLLALYWRIFRVTNARRPLQIVAALNIAWMIAATLIGIFSCVPVQAFWDATLKARCIHHPEVFASNESFTIVLDLVVLLMPVYFVSQTQRSLSQRISIISAFLTGLVVTVVSAVRLWQLVLARRKPGFDPTFNETSAASCAIVELNLWVIVASIPTLRPLVTKILRDRHEGSIAPHLKPQEYNSGSTRSLKARLWPSRYDSSTRAGALTADSSPSVPEFNAQVSITKPREPGWSPLSVDGDGKDYVRLQVLDGVRVDREVDVLLP